MSWLQGITTWANIVDKLTKLACGEVADDNAVTCAVGDRWARHVGGQDMLRTNASADVATGNVNFRAGYWALLTYHSENGPDAYAFRKTVCKQTVVFSGTPTGLAFSANNRWQMFIIVKTPNTSNGDYSTARVSWSIMDLDAATGTPATSLSNVALSSSGDLTITVGTKTMTVNITDPSGFLPRGACWGRAFSATYLGGIDYHGPFFRRRSAAATYSVNPPGTVTTDYVLDVDLPSSGVTSTTVTQTLNGQVPRPSDNANVSVANVEIGGLGCGVGIKTNAGLTGAQYTCAWNMFAWSLRLLPLSGASNGTIQAEHCLNISNDAGTYRRVSGFAFSSWLKPFSIPGSVDPASQVQYFMSVKADKIVIVLNGDPGASGQLTDAAVWKFTAIDYLGAGYDKFPYACSGTSQTAVGQQSFATVSWTYFAQALRQDTSTAAFPSGRDWQTKWGRSDTAGTALTNVLTDDSPSIGDFVGISSGVPGSTIRTPGVFLNTNALASDTSHPTVSSKPNPYTAKWRLYGFAHADIPWSTSGGGFSPSTPRDSDFPRGYVAGSVSSPFLIAPGGLWASGDEITDTVSGKKWFLVQHDVGAPGILQFGQLGAGIAVLEE